MGLRITPLGISFYAENQIIYWDFKIRNNVRVTKGSDNGDCIIKVLLYFSLGSSPSSGGTEITEVNREISTPYSCNI